MTKPTTTAWQAVIFDLDDTLYPERDYVLSGFQAVAVWVAATLGLPTPATFAELRGLLDQGLRGHIFDRWLADHQLQGNVPVSALVEVYRKHQPTIRVFPEVPEILTALHVSFRLGIVSDGYLEVQERKLAALGLAPYFDAVVFSDEWGHSAWKPAPRPFEEVLARLGNVPSTAAVYIADNPTKDFLGARRAGLASIRVAREGGVYSQLQPATPEYAPDITVPHLHDLPAVLLTGS